MSLADNFLQEQQKQRECRFKKGRGGNPLGGRADHATDGPAPPGSPHFAPQSSEVRLPHRRGRLAM